MSTEPGASAATTANSVLPRVVATAMRLAAAGASVCAALGWLRNRHMAGFGMWNTAPTGMVRGLTLLAIFGGALPVIAAAALWAKRPGSLASIERASRLAAPAILLMPLAWLFNWRAFYPNEPLCVVYAVITGLALEAALRTALSAAGRPALERWQQRLSARVSARVRQHLPEAILGLCVVLFAAWMSHHALNQHYRIQTSSFDLAIYDNMMWNLLHGDGFRAWPEAPDGVSHLAVHATLIAPLLLPFYALAQKAQTLLVVQAVLCAAAAIPVYLIAVRRLQSRAAGLTLALCYLVYAPLQQAMMYDFHFITLAPFFVGWTAWALESGKRLPLAALFALTLLVREDLAATMTVVAFAYLLAGVRPRWSAVGVLAAAAYFVVVKLVVMPRFHQGELAFSALYFHLGRPEQPGMLRVLQTLLLNPVFTLMSLLWPLKVTFVLKMCAPVLLLPLRNKVAWLLLVPGAVFTILTVAGPAFSTSFQHATHWTAVIFLATIWVLSDWATREDGWCRLPAAITSLAVMSVAMSYQFGLTFQHNTFWAGFRKIELPLRAPDQRNHDDLYELIRRIPSRASVTATENEAPHVSARPRCYTMRMGNPDADFLLLRTGEASEGDSREVMRLAIESGAYGWVASSGQYDLWAKGAPTDQNAMGAARIGLGP